MKNEPDKKWFTRQLRTALTCLYDPAVLRNSPLVELLGVDQRRPIFALRRILTDAIETLRPGTNTPTGSKSWRVYQVLRRRYTEQVTQRELAADLGLSIRQLQREEPRARGVLADHLWTVYHLETKVQKRRTATPSHAQADHVGSKDTHLSTRDRELEWLKDHVAAQITDIGDVIHNVLRTFEPVLASSGVTVAYTAQENLPLLFLKELLLQQALMNLVDTAIRYAPGGKASIQTGISSRQLSIVIQATTAAPSQDGSSQPKEAQPEGLRMAEQLIQLCGGSLKIGQNVAKRGVFTAKITLPVTEQAILVIDDNDDTRRLFQRYLSGSRYRFFGAPDAQRGLALAKELNPQIIVLDVMMPERDGWTVLGQLRAHPATQHIPIVVCSIVSQKELAYALGAAEFIRKPVSRMVLLSALDHQLDLLQRESH